MNGLARWMVFWLGSAIALFPLCAAEVPGFASPPWHGPGAVLPPVTDSERRQDSGAVLISGFAMEPGKLEFELRGGKWKDMQLSGGFNTSKKRWEIRLGDFDGRVLKELPAGTAFDLKAVQGSVRKGYASELRNVAMGPVWVLVVSPGTDGFELPSLTDAARRRVRVLDLQGSNWADARGTWMGAAEAERMLVPGFCGLPRAFANALSEEGSGAGEDHAIGLVLVPVSFLEGTLAEIDRRQLSVPMDLDAFLTKAGRTNLWLQAGARAAKRANVSDAPGSDGANQREARALATYRARNYDLFREGRPVQPFSTRRYSWRYSMGGADAQSRLTNSGRALVPFRVTGVIWGEDQALQPHRQVP